MDTSLPGIKGKAIGQLKRLFITKSTVLKVQAFLILREFLLHNFALMQPQNLHHSLNLCDNFQINVIWHQWSLAVTVLCCRLSESDDTVTPTVKCVD